MPAPEGPMIARQLPARTLPLQEWRIVLSAIETERFVHVMGRPEGFFSATHMCGTSDASATVPEVWRDKCEFEV